MNAGILITSVLFAAVLTVPGISFAQNMGDDPDKIGLPACLVGTSTDCDQSGLFHDAIATPFSQSDSVAIGTIIQKESMGEKSIAYSISVDFYLKNYQPFDLLTATLNDAPKEVQSFPEVWYYNSPIFNEGDLIFAYLVKNDGSYELLPKSFALDKQENRGPPPHIHLTKSPSEGTFLQGEKILVSGEVRKMELVKAAKNGERLGVELTLHRPYDEREVFFSDLIDIDANGHYDYHLDTSNISPGEYHLKVKYGPSSSSTDIIIDYNSKYWSPLKQLKSGIPVDEIQCRTNLQKMLKQDGTPVCVTHETAPKIAERGWNWVLDLELWEENYLLIPATDYVIKNDGVTYGSQYVISGAIVSEISYDQNANSLKILMSNSPERGILQIVMPSGLLHLPSQAPFSYFVLADGEEIEYEKISPIILKIPFDIGTEELEIIGTYWP